MEESSEQNRSEKPTPFKLNKARQRGAVARGLDLGFLTGLAAFVGYMWMMGPQMGGEISLAARRAIVTAPGLAVGSNEILLVTGAVLTTVARPLAFMAGAIFLAVLAFEIVQTGFVFSLEPLRPNFGKLNPASGLKRLFSVRLLIETGKNVLKLAVYVTLAGLVILSARKAVVPAITDGRGLAEALGRTGFRLLILFMAAAVAFAALDQLIVRRDFLKRMRMSRREVRREVRDREGDPRLKQRRKQLHREFAKMSKSLRNVRGADVLITNPTHYAVALRYDTRTMAAPTVVSRGANQYAQRLKRAAFLYGVVIVENRELARSLYYRSELDREVPEAFYRPVADVYRQVRKKNRLKVSASA